MNLIEQKLPQSKRLRNGNHYLLKMKIYLSKRMVNDFYNTASFSNSKLVVYFAKYKVKYQKEAGKDDKVCTSKYKNRTTYFGAQDYFQVASFDLANYPTEQWLTVSQDFYVPVSNLFEADSYKWFVIEIINKNETSSCRRAYVLIDDISVEQGCYSGCSSTDGVYRIHTNGIVTYNHLLLISGLENITQVRFRFFVINGSFATDFFVYDNPANTIGWDGRNINGYPLADGSYIMEVDATNDCGTEVLYFSIQKLGTYSYYYNYDSFYVNLTPIPVSKPPEPCCLYNLTLSNQILVEDKTLNHPLTYKVQNQIQVGPNIFIPPNNNVVMTAGDNIIFKPPFHSQGNLHAFIESCNAPQLTNDQNNSEEFISCDTTTNKIMYSSDVTTNKFIVYPNSFNSIINIISLSPNNDFNIEIYNLLGEKLFTYHSFEQGVKINTSDFNKGVFLIKIFDNSTEKSFIYKIIKYK